MVRRIVGFALLVGAAATVARSEEPFVEHQPVACVTPGAHPRICATVADDGFVQRSRVYFRALGEEAWYWSPATFDGLAFCATLPVPRRGVPEVEYYVWAVDDELLVARTDTLALRLTEQCEYPVEDDDPERTGAVEVHATTKKQGRKVREFERASVALFVPFGS